MYHKTTVTRTKEDVMEYLESLGNSELVVIHNEYCDSINDMDSIISSNDEDFFETFFSGEVMDALRATSYGEWNFNDDYVMFNGYGNLESFNDPSDHIDLGEIADDILENERNYSGIELEDPEEEEEEDEDSDEGEEEEIDE
jgi:hypothetical protein